MPARSIQHNARFSSVGGDTPLPVRALDAASRRTETEYQGQRVVWRSWGRGPAVVLLHGGFGSWTHWLRTIPALSRTFTVIAPDMPGFGDSDAPVSDDLLQSIPEALIAGLPQVLGAAQGFDLVGFSFGSVIAGTLAARLADLEGPLAVGRLILVAPAGLGIPVSDWESLAKTRPGMTTAELAEVHRHNMGVILFKDRAAIDQTALALQMANVARTRVFGRSHSRSDQLVKAAARLRGTRVIAAWGDGDAYAHRNRAAYESAVAGLRPDIAIHRIAGGGHWVQYEAADAFNAFLVAVLQEVAP